MMFSKKQQQGSILLLALLVMSGSVVVGLTIGTIVINEVRQSKNIDDAISSYYIAESGIEQGMYLYRKDYTAFENNIEEVPTGDPVPSNPQDCYFDMGGYLGGEAQCVSYWQDSAAQTITLNPSAVQQIDFYNDDLDFGYGMDALVVEWIDTNPYNGIEPWLEMEYITLDTDFHSSDQENMVFVQPCGNSGGGSNCDAINSTNYAIASNYPDTNQNYKVRFRSLYDTVTLTITAYDSESGGGASVVENRAVDIFATGGYGTALQSLKATISTGVNTTKAFADYVIFSECDLVKGYGVSSLCP